MIQKAAKYFSTAYILLMFCIYPFYMENGYYNIGEAKMNFFLRVSLAAFVVLAVLYFVLLVKGVWARRQERQAYLIDWEQISAVDLLMLVYATVLFLSYVFSANKEEALWGAEGWYMGLIPQLLLCALYFLISRLWTGSEKVLYPVMMATAVVFVLGICNRFSYYPIVVKGAQPDFISTLGNINWFCGFLSVVAPLGIGYFVVETSGILWKRVLLGFYAFIVFMAGFSQGSDSIFLWFGAVLVLLLWIAAEDGRYMKRWFLLVLLWAMAAGMIAVLRVVTVDKFNYDTNGLCGYFTSSYIWAWIAAVAVGGLIFYHVRSEKENIRKGLVALVVVSLILWVLLSIVNTLVGVSFLEGNTLFTFDANWGHGRGVTVWTGIRTFGEQPLLQKLIGVGPDCFASAAYKIPEVTSLLREHFGSARLTNAHNECVTVLVNTGVLGVCSYVGLLLTCVVRYVKAGKDTKDVLFYACAVSVAGYFVHNMVSFAQVLNFPFIFIIIGMAEAKKRHLR
ncbi:MAG: O-antigen ligase family protein [Lachnospiraceae bacterium]|nr:O-antigen ligase family protein [Lachnospiraceae bacterium]